MFGKLTQSSVSWSVYMVITIILAACVLTIFAYSALGLNCIGSGSYEDCEDGDGCDGVTNACLSDWKIDGEIACVHYDPDVNDCRVTVYSDHSAWYSNTCGTNITVDWMYSNWLGPSNEDGAQFCPTDGTLGDVNHRKAPGRGIVPGHSTFTNTFSGMLSTWELIPDCDDYQAFYYTRHAGPGHADAGDGEIVETACR